MTRCHCTAIACPNKRHTATLCAQPAELEVQSRDWGDEIIPMCYVCWIDARGSGIFKRALRKPQFATAIVETVVDGRLC